MARGIQFSPVFSILLTDQRLYIVGNMCVCLYIYIYIYIYVCVCVCVYVCRETERLYINYLCCKIILGVKHFYTNQERCEVWPDIYHWCAGLEVTGWISRIRKHVLQFSFQIGSSSSPSYIQIFFLIAFLEEAFIRNLIIIIWINYKIIILKHFNNNEIINNSYAGHPVLIFSSKFLRSRAGISSKFIENIRYGMTYLLTEIG